MSAGGAQPRWILRGVELGLRLELGEQRGLQQLAQLLDAPIVVARPTTQLPLASSTSEFEVLVPTGSAGALTANGRSCFFRFFHSALATGTETATR